MQAFDLLEFLVGDEPYVVRLDMIAGVERVGTVTPLAGAPAWVDGRMAGARGSLLLLHLATLIAGTDRPIRPRTRVLVVDCEGLVIGLRTDGGTRVLRAAEHMVAPPPKQATAPWLAGVVRCEERPVMLIEPHRLLNAEQRDTVVRLALPSEARTV